MNRMIHLLPILVVTASLLSWFILKIFFVLDSIDSLFQALVFGAIFGTLLHQYIVFNTERIDKIFFELMSWHRELRSSIEGTVNIKYPMEPDNRDVHSRGMSFLLNVSTKIHHSIELNHNIELMLNNISYNLRNDYIDNNSSLKDLLLNYIRHKYNDNIHKYHDVHLSSYFRSLYNCIISIEEKQITSKRSYSDLIQSNLSQFEMHLLMYNGLTEYGKKFHKLIEDYLLIENIRISLPPSKRRRQEDPFPVAQSVAFKWLIFRIYYPNNYLKFCQKSWNDKEILDKNLEHFADKESLKELLQ